MLRLSSKDIDKVLFCKGTFELAERVTGVPWEAIAAVWFRESFSVAPPKRPGGPFQFDPPTRSYTDLHGLLDRFTKGLSEEQKRDLIRRFPNEFGAAAIFAACWLRHSCKPVIVPDISDEVAKDMFYGYNGREYGSVERSPYVMNQIDETRMNMRIRGTVRRPDGSEEWVDVVDTRPGAFVVYKQLKALKH